MPSRSVSTVLLPEGPLLGDNNKMKASKYVAIGSLSLFALLALIGVLSESFRERVQNYLYPPFREVLATAEGDLLNDGSLVKAVKYKGRDGIFVEVLRPPPKGEGSFALIDRIELPDKHDGLFNFHGHVTRLAITDVDGNGSQELLAPTFDAQLVPHLNVFRFNPTLGRFELLQPPENP